MNTSAIMAAYQNLNKPNPLLPVAQQMAGGNPIIGTAQGLAPGNPILARGQQLAGHPIAPPPPPPHPGLRQLKNVFGDLQGMNHQQRLNLRNGNHPGGFGGDFTGLGPGGLQLIAQAMSQGQLGGMHLGQFIHMMRHPGSGPIPIDGQQLGGGPALPGGPKIPPLPIGKKGQGPLYQHLLATALGM